MAHRRQVIDLVGLCLLDDTDQIGAVRHISIVETKPYVFFMRVLVEMIDAFGIDE